MNITKLVGRIAVVAVFGVALGAIVCACGFPGIVPSVGDVFTVPFPG